MTTAAHTHDIPTPHIAVSATPREAMAQTAARSEHPYSQLNVVVVVPAYNEERQITDVLNSMPTWVRTVVVVDDASTDDTGPRVASFARTNQRIVLIRHKRNAGVGGAMVTGFAKAIQLGAQVVVKMDADGQMSPEHLAQLIRPLVDGEADYAKGNRFHDFRALGRMPKLRRLGNMVLSFLTKGAVGYWNIFDPCNGYVAIRGEVLSQIPLHKIGQSFYFETSMLSQLYLQGAVVKDVPMPARYGDEKSHLSIPRIVGEFPARLLASFSKRMVLKHFVYDFSMCSLYLVAGLPMLLGGTAFGVWKWLSYAQAGVSAPTGTVVIPALLIILGFQLVLAATAEDLRSVPRQPLQPEPLDTGPPRQTNSIRRAPRRSVRRRRSSDV